MKKRVHNPHRIDIVLRNRYILALSILAFLIILSQIAIQFAINKNQDDSRIINIAGRQRMLSQKITKNIYGLYMTSDTSIDKEYLKELKSAVSLYRDSHKGLQYGNESMLLPGKNSNTIIAMFSNIENDHQNILQLADKIIKQSENGSINNNLLRQDIPKLRNYERRFLKGMDAIVFQYDAESKAKINFIKYMEIGLFLFTFFVIFLEMKLIFIPAEKEIQKTFNAVSDNYDNFKKMFDISPLAMLLADKDTLDLIEINRMALNKLIGFSFSPTPTSTSASASASTMSASLSSVQMEAASLKLETLFQVSDYDVDINNHIIDRIKNSDQLIDQEVILNTPHRGNMPVLISSSRISINNKDSIIIGISDISKQKEYEKILEHFASVDGMTGLLNKRAGLLELEHIFSNTKSNGSNKNFSLCFIDIDALKTVNDFYGHDEGDFYIKTIAKLILDSLRMDDHAFRYGGDEIIILLDQCNVEKAKHIIERIEENLAELEALKQKPYTMSFSTGIVDYLTFNGSSAGELMRNADELMYESKKIKKRRS
jgi:diguanylate cyclase (GGDEF)-like protein